MGSHQDLLLRYWLTDFYKMVSLKVVLAFAIISSTVAVYVGKVCRSDRDCPGKCKKVPDYWCHIGNLFGNQNRCDRFGSRCTECLVDQDCARGKQCTANYCLARTTCYTDSQCPGDKKCSNNKCRDDSRGDACRYDFECGVNQKCLRYTCKKCRYSLLAGKEICT